MGSEVHVAAQRNLEQKPNRQLLPSLQLHIVVVAHENVVARKGADELQKNLWSVRPGLQKLNSAEQRKDRH